MSLSAAEANNRYVNDLAETARRANRQGTSLDNQTLMEVIRELGILLCIEEQGYIGFQDPQIAQTVIDSLRQRRPNYLDGTSKRSSQFQFMGQEKLISI